MRAIVIIAALALAGCGSQVEAPESGVPEGLPQNTEAVSEIEGGIIFKFCDEGRAVYVASSFRGNAMTIAEDAKECQNSG